MNLYQIGLYRIGQQDAKSGWQIVSPSMGISSVASETFEQIASAVFEAKNKIDATQSRGVFLQDGFVFFVNFNFNAKGEDERGVSYAHSYCFTLKDYLELVKQPEKLAGVAAEAFPTEYDASIGSYPVVHDLACKELDWKSILTKYGISMETYREMVLAAICASCGKSNPLCIKKSLAAADYMEFYNDMLYVIMMGMPEYLRVKVSSFSFRESNRVALYVSDIVEGDNYVDLDAGLVNVQYSALAKYQFTMIYNNLVQTQDIRILSGLWTMISEQMEETLARPLRDLNIDMVEAAYQATIKKSEAGGIDSDYAIDLLTAFLEFSLLNSQKTDLYLTDLLEVINGNGLNLTDNVLKRKLSEHYDTTSDREFRNQVDVLNGRALLREMEMEDAFNALDAMRRDYPEQYENVYRAIRKENLSFAYNYYLDRILPDELSNYRIIKEHLNELNEGSTSVGIPQTLIEQDYLITIGAILKLMLENIPMSTSYEELDSSFMEGLSALKLVKSTEKIKLSLSDVIKKTCCSYWDAFKLDWFSIDNIDVYRSRDYRLDRVVDKYMHMCSTNTAEVVFELCQLEDNVLTDEKLALVQRILYTDEYPMSGAKKNELRKALFKHWFESTEIDMFQDLLGFDALLTLCYDPEKDVYYVAQFAKYLSRLTKGRCFENLNVEKFVRRSQLLKSNDYKNQFINDVNALYAKYRKNDVNVPESDMKGLKKYVDVLNGKELKDEEQINVISQFFTTLYRAFLGAAACGAFILFAKSVQSYLEWGDAGKIILYVCIALIALGFIGIGLINIFVNDGFEGLLENKSLDEPVRLISYIALIVLLLCGLGATILFHKFVICMWLVLAYLVVACVLMVVSDSFIEE